MVSGKRIVVIDDDVYRLSPFFLPLLAAKGYDVRAFERWGKALEWLEQAPPSEKDGVSCVVLDIMFVLPAEDHAVYRRLTGADPERADARQAGARLLPVIRQSLHDVPILILSNYPFNTGEGQSFRNGLESSPGVMGVFEKPAQEDFYEALSGACSRVGGENG